MLKAAAAQLSATQGTKQLLDGISSTNGIFALNKPPGISCAGLLQYFKRNLGREAAAFTFAEHFEKERQLRETGRKIHRPKVRDAVRIGHGGTLDVEAAGVLVVGIDKGCKRLGTYLTGGKSYIATGMLGVSTASRDAEGTIVGVADASGISGDMVQERIPEFIGDIKQMPPMHSAIKVNGQPLYRYAREGWKVPKEVEPRAVTIRKIKLLRLNNPVAKALSTGTRVALPREHADYFLSGAYQWRGNGEEMVPGNVMLPFANHPEMPTFQVYVESGGGVYIRSLIHDLGERLGCGATMISLIRTTQGPLRLGRDTIEPSDLPFVDRVIAAVRQADNVLEHRL